MIIDALTKMSAAQAVTASAASTSYIDTVAAGQAIADPLTAVLSVDTTTDSSGDAALLDFTIQTDTESTFSSPTTIATLSQKAQAVLVAGAKFDIPLPKEGMQRYIRGYYTVSGANFTAGAFSLELTKDADIGNIS